jgi:hypothetical protein
MHVQASLSQAGSDAGELNHNSEVLKLYMQAISPMKNEAFTHTVFQNLAAPFSMTALNFQCIAHCLMN